MNNNSRSVGRADELQKTRPLSQTAQLLCHHVRMKERHVPVVHPRKALEDGIRDKLFHIFQIPVSGPAFFFRIPVKNLAGKPHDFLRHFIVVGGIEGVPERPVCAVTEESKVFQSVLYVQ